MDERLVAVEQAMPAGEQVTLQPPLAQVLRQHLHDPAIGRQVVVAGLSRRSQVRSVASKTACSRLEAVSSGPMTRKESGLSVRMSRTRVAENAGRLARRTAGLVDRHGVGAEVPDLRSRSTSPPFVTRVGAHPPVAPRRQPAQILDQSAVVVEELLGAVGLQPLLQELAVAVIGPRPGQRDLVGAERALNLLTVDLLGAGPALRRAQDDHRPSRLTSYAFLSSLSAGSRRCRPMPRRAWRP